MHILQHDVMADWLGGPGWLGQAGLGEQCAQPLQGLARVAQFHEGQSHLEELAVDR